MSSESRREWGFWTEQKLDILGDYLSQFLIASKRATTRLYVDAFSGDGQGVSKHDSTRSIVGSPIVALEAGGASGFTHLRFVEKNQDLVARLAENIATQFAQRDAHAIAGDCNVVVPELLDSLRANDLHFSPTFVFLDPDGLELKWSTICAVSDFKRELFESKRVKAKAEMFVLLNTSGFVREVSADLSRATPRITDLVGSTEWRPIAGQLLSGEIDGRQACADFTNLMRWRLEKVLGYQESIDLPFFNTKESELYRMIFVSDHAVGGKIMRPLFDRAKFFGPELLRRARDDNRGQLSLDLGSKPVPKSPDVRYEPPVQPAS